MQTEHGLKVLPNYWCTLGVSRFDSKDLGRRTRKNGAREKGITKAGLKTELEQTMRDTLRAHQILVDDVAKSKIDEAEGDDDRGDDYIASAQRIDERESHHQVC